MHAREEEYTAREKPQLAESTEKMLNLLFAIKPLQIWDTTFSMQLLQPYAINKALGRPELRTLSCKVQNSIWPWAPLVIDVSDKMVSDS